MEEEVDDSGDVKKATSVKRERKEKEKPLESASAKKARGNMK